MGYLGLVLAEYGYTQRDLSHLIGSRSRASEYVRGTRQPTVEAYRMMRMHFGIPLDRLMGIPRKCRVKRRVEVEKFLAGLEPSPPDGWRVGI